MSKMPIAWHEMCLKNKKIFREERYKEMENLSIFIKRIEEEYTFYEKQIEEAKKRGLEEFDDDRLLITRKKKMENKLEGRINIQFEEEGCTISLRDNLSRRTFLQITMDQKQTLLALSRLYDTHCTFQVKDLDKVGLVQEREILTFEISGNDSIKETAIKLAVEKCPEGWTPDLYFDSQGSFIYKNDKTFARTTIRRWVKKEE